MSSRHIRQDEIFRKSYSHGGLTNIQMQFPIEIASNGVIDSGELRATEINGNTVPFGLLSDGVRNMIGLVADIVHKMAQLNPALEDSILQETPGVVLIDELDLQPSWERRIVDDLKRTFPKV